MRERSLTDTTTRREFLARPSEASEAHIASVLVHTRPSKIPLLESRLAQLGGVETHGSSASGKLIVTIEVDSDRQLVDRMSQIELEPDVIAATLVYHHVGDVDDEG